MSRANLIPVISRLWWWTCGTDLVLFSRVVKSDVMCCTPGKIESKDAANTSNTTRLRTTWSCSPATQEHHPTLMPNQLKQSPLHRHMGVLRQECSNGQI